MKLSDVVESCFILNLDKRPDRLRAVTREIEVAGLSLYPGKIERFSAIRPSEALGFPSIGAHGVFLSHLAMLREAKKRGLEHYAVLEDDLVFTPHFLENQAAIAEDIQNSDWELIWFGNTHDYSPPNDQAGFFHPYNEPILTATLVIIHSRLYDRLEKFFEEVLSRPPGHPLGGPQHVDGAYNMFREQNPDVKTLLASPSLVEQKGFASDIQALPWYYRLPLIGQLGRLAVRVKRELSKKS